jgi:hypothetical protein
MARNYWGESPHTRYSRSLRLGEGQGRHREVMSGDAGRRTGTGSEVWYTRDEWAGDHEVLHPHRGVLYKSGAYASTVTSLTPGGLPYAGTSRLRLNVRLRGEQSTLSAWQESAEGKVGTFSFLGMDERLRPHRETGWSVEPQPEAMRRCVRRPERSPHSRG